MRYVTWSWHDENQSQHKDQVHLFDIKNPTTPSPLYPDAKNQLAPFISDGKIYSGTVSKDVTDGWDVWIYDIEDQKMSWLDHSPYDQIAGHADGHIVAYLDTEELKSYYYQNGMKAHVEIQDLETHLTRQITIVDDNYFGIAVSGKYLVFGVHIGNDVLVVCDLEAGGFIDKAGHVMPEGAIPDAGADGGNG